MSVYSVTRKQLKEIIEGLITTLSVLLNLAQKFSYNHFNKNDNLY